MNEDAGLSSAFPAPPREYELFTKENIEAFANDPSQVAPEVAEAMRPPDIPTEPYTIFGDRWPVDEKLPSLKDAGVTQLYPDDCDRVVELKKLSRSFLLNFLELTTIMGTSPEQFPPKVEHLRLIMLNMHHLINEYRPHQARESLITLMEQQLARRTNEAEEIESKNSETRKLLDRYSKISTPLESPSNAVGAVTNSHQDPESSIANESEEEKSKKRDLYMFDVLSSTLI